MSFIRRHSRLLLVAVSCAVLGAAASAIAGAGATTPAKTSHGANAAGATRAKAAGRSVRARGLRRFAARAVHGDLVVHTQSGFVTVTFDRGKVDSVNGQQLTITEGTKKASYKTVTLTIPSNATVRANRQTASLSGLKPGQRVAVLEGPKRTLVIAHTS
jgi:hypothetical protein